MSNTTQAPEGLTKRTLLVADDDRDVRSYLVETLSAVEGLEVLSAEDGLDAIAIVSKTPHLDAVLTDFRMPKVTGLDFLAEMQKMGCFLPVVMISAYAEMKLFREAMRMGVVDFLEKPVEKRALLESVNYAVELGHVSRQMMSEIRQMSPKGSEKLNQLAFFRHILNSLLIDPDQHR